MSKYERIGSETDLEAMPVNSESSSPFAEELKQERDRLRLLLDVNNAVVSILDLRELFRAVSNSVRQVVPHDYACLSLYDSETRRVRIHALEFPASKGVLHEGLSFPVEDSPAARWLSSRKPVFLNGQELRDFRSEFADRIRVEGHKSVCCLPLFSHDRPLGNLVLASLNEDTFPQKDAELLQHIANQIALAVENAVAFGRVVDLANKLTEEKLYLQEEIRAEHDFEEIIGESSALRAVLQQVKTAAPTDATVLIHGETGTGKELIARAIHNLSVRRDRPLVKINCAAIPTGLLESGLFGHEKGAFTGAISRRIGRFELAHGGTLFLDEIGDIPLELQPKLLRVLQEQEFERLGSTRTLQVDVRVIAATNSDLAQMVASKQFRSDLYYRLRVFPIIIPPLRDRREDIPRLVRYFAQKYSQRMKKIISSVPGKSMRTLTQYDWPGNIRELENLIERAVILSSGSELSVPLSELTPPPAGQPSTNSLEAAERRQIVEALRQSNWVVGGPTGAAARLGLKRTTLVYKMQKLGIHRCPQ